MKFIALLGLFLTCFMTAKAAKKFPSYFPRCNRFSPKLNECLLKATETVKPFLVKGVPELSVPSIEPFDIPQITLQQGTSALNFKATLNNVKIFGLSNYKFQRFDFDVPSFTWFCKAVVAPLRLEGKYDVVGKILLAPIVGSGKFVAQIAMADVDVIQKAKLQKRKSGKEYVVPIFTNSTIRVEKPKATLDGLFGNGNEELARTTNKIIADNVDELFQEIRPVIEEVFNRLLEDLLVNAFESQIPFDELYPPKA